jgi:esterase/lipase superfamily enzyme
MIGSSGAGSDPNLAGGPANGLPLNCRPMQKQAWTWTTPHFSEPARMARWGHYGTPVLIFPTAGGDFEEIERFHLVGALSEPIERGQIKVYSIDGLCVRAWLAGKDISAYDSFLYGDVLQRIREDCQNPRIEPVLAGASRGAAMAIGGLCRHPDAFRAAIGVSGVYDFAPLASVAAVAGQQLERLRHRSIVLGCGTGDYENPADSQRLSQALEAKGIPCRLSLWDPTRDHTWSTWREMFPRLLAEQAQG